MPRPRSREIYPAALRPEIEALETSGISQLFALGVDREGVIPLWFGEGDLPTPDFICAAAIRSLEAGNTFYSHKRGHPRPARGHRRPT